MRSPLAVAALLAMLGCSRESPNVAPARAAFERYQDALFAGDRRALRELLTMESRAVVPHLPWDSIADQQRLEVVGAVPRAPEVLLTIRDPNAGGVKRTYVVVREHGAMRVDLVATTAFNHIRRANPDGGLTFEPRQLTPDELARVQANPPAGVR